MLSRLKAAWNWLPVIVRAIVLGFILLEIGSTVTFLPLLGNLKFRPEIPWAFALKPRGSSVPSLRNTLHTPRHAFGVQRFRQWYSGLLR